MAHAGRPQPPQPMTGGEEAPTEGDRPRTRPPSRRDRRDRRGAAGPGSVATAGSPLGIDAPNVVSAGVAGRWSRLLGRADRLKLCFWRPVAIFLVPLPSRGARRESPRDLALRVGGTEPSLAGCLVPQVGEVRMADDAAARARTRPRRTRLPFPLRPLGIRGVSDVSGLPQKKAGRRCHRADSDGRRVGTVRQYAGAWAAHRATLLVAVFPATFVFNLVYAEGMTITLVALGLMALLRWRAALGRHPRHRWRRQPRRSPWHSS